METLKFEALVAVPTQLEKLSDVLARIPNVIDWYTDRISDYFLLSVKGVNIRAHDIIRALGAHGIRAEQLYEE